MFYFSQISAKDDCQGNRTPYRESREAKPQRKSITKQKTYDLSSLRTNWLKSKFTISSGSLLSNRFNLIVGAGLHVWWSKSRRGSQNTLDPNVTNSATHFTKLTSTLLRQDGQSTLHDNPSLGSSPSRQVLQKEWRHERTFGSLYCSKQIVHSSSFNQLSATDEAFAILVFLFCEQQNKCFFSKLNWEESLPLSTLISSLLLSKASKKHFLITWQIECSRAFQLVTGVSRYFSCGKSCKVSEERTESWDEVPPNLYYDSKVPRCWQRAY